MGYPYSPASIPSSSSYGMVDPLLDPSTFNLFNNADLMGYTDMQPQAMSTFGALGHSSMYDDLVHHYFDRVSKIQFVFVGSYQMSLTEYVFPSVNIFVISSNH